jgi:hypothetical protein
VKKNTKKRRKLGAGYIWFVGSGANGYTGISLYKGAHATGPEVALKLHGLGAWQKVNLYAEFVS